MQSACIRKGRVSFSLCGTTRGTEDMGGTTEVQHEESEYTVTVQSKPFYLQNAFILPLKMTLMTIKGVIAQIKADKRVKVQNFSLTFSSVP